MSKIVTLKAADSDSTASISVDRGFNCFEFKADVDGRIVDVIDSESGFSDGDGRVSGFQKTKSATTTPATRFTDSALIVPGELSLKETISRSASFTSAKTLPIGSTSGQRTSYSGSTTS